VVETHTCGTQGGSGGLGHKEHPQASGAASWRPELQSGVVDKKHQQVTWKQAAATVDEAKPHALSGAILPHLRFIHACKCVPGPSQARRTGGGGGGGAPRSFKDLRSGQPAGPWHGEHVHVRPHLGHTPRSQDEGNKQKRPEKQGRRSSRQACACEQGGTLQGQQQLHGANGAWKGAHLLCGGHQEGGHLHLLPRLVQQLRRCEKVFRLAPRARPNVDAVNLLVPAVARQVTVVGGVGLHTSAHRRSETGRPHQGSKPSKVGSTHKTRSGAGVPQHVSSAGCTLCSMELLECD
jgi:hypothetical protein